MTQRDNAAKGNKPDSYEGKAAHSGGHGPEGRLEPGSSLDDKQDQYAKQTDAAQGKPAAKPATQR